MGDFVLYEQQDRVVILTLNRPEERNAIGDLGQCKEIITAVQKANSDPSVSAIILTGTGKAFCAGGNIKKMREYTGFGLAEDPTATRNNYKRGIQSVTLALWETEIPTIAAVNGPAIGAGCDLACTCDIRIASESAKFAESFLKVGLIPGDGGAWLLPRVVGFSKAAEMSFTGDTLDANQALECGLVSTVVTAENLMDEALSLAKRITCNPPQALRLTKRLLRESHHMRLPELLELSAAYQAMAHESEDHQEALKALFEKRDPIFKGK
ncbi:MAG: crotonase/enoyl-CoA hydratase family protein [Gammaproteobacteria bacterium]|nr:crotonase/enoyl-CoA hydratase family protein [Gammaproteobacteria bacterium]